MVGTRLLTLDPSVKGHMEAIAGGRLGVNDAGCFTVNHRVLVGPAGSDIHEGGEGVTLNGIGSFKLGDEVRGGGGYIERPLGEVPDQKPCFPGKRWSRVAVVSTPLQD